MSKLSLMIKRDILKLHAAGLSANKIRCEIKTRYDLQVSRQAINNFLASYKSTNRLVRKPGSGRPIKITDTVKRAVEAKLQADDETTATQLAAILSLCGVSISLATIKRSRELLGWTYHGTHS